MAVCAPYAKVPAKKRAAAAAAEGSIQRKAIVQ